MGAPWYRQFWPWFLIALPASAVVAGLATVWIAVSDADPLVRPDWYASGRDINQSIAREREAGRLGVRVALTMTAIDGVLVARVSGIGGAELPEFLDLVLRHPTQAFRDRRIRLSAAGDAVFKGHVDLGAPDVWNLELAPPGNEWRLTARAGLPARTPVVLGRGS